MAPISGKKKTKKTNKKTKKRKQGKLQAWINSEVQVASGFWVHVCVILSILTSSECRHHPRAEELTAAEPGQPSYLQATRSRERQDISSGSTQKIQEASWSEALGEYFSSL